MSTYVDTLNKARKVIKEHVDNNIEELIDLQHGGIAVFAICRDLNISMETDRALVELVQQVYTSAIKEYSDSKKRLQNRKLSDMKDTEKDNYIQALESQMDIVAAMSERSAKEAIRQIDKLEKENDRLRGKSKKTTKKPGFFARLFAKLLGKDLVQILEEEKHGKGRQDQRFLK